MAILMGILNVTPDSFFAPSRAADTSSALSIAAWMLSHGASIIDIGAVSTRPGAADVTLEQEWSRLEGILSVLAGSGLLSGEEDGLPRLSLDTTRSEIVRRAVEVAGPLIVNDISAGRDDPSMLRTAGRLGLPYVAMHKRGNPRTMDLMTDYPDGVVAEVCRFFRDFEVKAAEAGIREWILDPGFGFAKTDLQNMELLNDLSIFRQFGRKILVGIADKRFTRGRTSSLQERAVRNGADILRVHMARKP